MSVGSLRLAYYEFNEHISNTIIFIHGNSGSSKTWQYQLGDPLFSNLKQIAIDLPGHGNSEKSINPKEDYSPIGTASIISRAIEMLVGNNHYVLVGFSYGTNVIAEALDRGLRADGAVLIGSCVLGKEIGLDKVFKQSTTPSIFGYNENDKARVETFLRQNIREADDVSVLNCIQEYFSVDPQFKPALFQGAEEGKISDEISALQKLNTQPMVIFGSEDQLVNVKYLDALTSSFWQKNIYKLPVTGHWVHIEKADEVNILISRYAEDVFK